MKKEYKKPELKEVKLQHRAYLLQPSNYDKTLGFYVNPVEEPKV